MKKYAVILSVVVGLFVLADHLIAADAETKVLYVCNCGETCTCGKAVSRDPGACGCSRTLMPMRFLKRVGDEAYLCSCGRDCTCKVDEKNPAKCSCGRPVRKVVLKKEQAAPESERGMPTEGS
jgi:hypothetical protein